MNWVLLIAMILLTITFVPLFCRRKVALWGKQKLEVLADSLWKDISSRKLTGDDRLRLIHDAIVLQAYCAPLMVSGLDFIDTENEIPSNTIKVYLEDNPWLLLYLSTSFWIIWILDAFGKPYSPIGWFKAGIAILILKKFSDSSGRVVLGFYSTGAERISKKLKVGESYKLAGLLR